MHRGRYVQPWTAAGELIDGIVGPYLEDVRRLAGLGRMLITSTGVRSGSYLATARRSHPAL
jgi:hypothetical protein